MISRVAYTIRNTFFRRGLLRFVEGRRLCHGTVAQWPVQDWAYEVWTKEAVNFVVFRSLFPIPSLCRSQDTTVADVIERGR